jgi:hypothetical protein
MVKTLVIAHLQQLAKLLRICVLQDNFATVLKTAVTIIVVDVATNSNRRYVFSHITLNLC